MKRSQVVVLCTCLAAGILTIALLGWRLYQSNFWRGPDAQFGDQHLKTTVALVELHKIRYSRYPIRLDELKFLGDWDPIALNSVRYVANATATRYCVQVERGWIGKPNLDVPAEFWRNTGYDPALCEQK
jgi:hypothetical protein